MTNIRRMPNAAGTSDTTESDEQATSTPAIVLTENNADSYELSDSSDDETPTPGIRPPPNTPVTPPNNTTSRKSKDILMRAIHRVILAPSRRAASSDEIQPQEKPIFVSRLKPTKIKLLPILPEPRKLIPFKTTIKNQALNNKFTPQTPAWRLAHGRQNGILIDEASGLAKDKLDPDKSHLFQMNPEPEVGGDAFSFTGANSTVAPDGRVIPEQMELSEDGELVMTDGRSKGRKLIPWHRPRMFEKCLLHLIYEMHRRGIEIPYDAAVKRLAPWGTGNAFQQALNKLRDVMIAEGHLVPPALSKIDFMTEANVRGYVRDMTSDDPFKARLLKWDEEYEDLEVSLLPKTIVRGSGNNKKNGGGMGMGRTIRFRREAQQRVENARAAAAGEEPRLIRRDRVPEEQRRMEKAAKKRKISKIAGSVDFKELEKIPEVTSAKQTKRYSTRSKTGKLAKRSYAGEEDPFVDTEDDDEDFEPEVLQGVRNKKTDVIMPSIKKMPGLGFEAAPAKSGYLIRNTTSEVSLTPKSGHVAGHAKLRSHNEFAEPQEDPFTSFNDPSMTASHSMRDPTFGRGNDCAYAYGGVPGPIDMAVGYGLAPSMHTTAARQVYDGFASTNGGELTRTPDYTSSPYMPAAANGPSTVEPADVKWTLPAQEPQTGNQYMGVMSPGEWLRNNKRNRSSVQANNMLSYDTDACAHGLNGCGSPVVSRPPSFYGISDHHYQDFNAQGMFAGNNAQLSLPPGSAFTTNTDFGLGTNHVVFSAEGGGQNGLNQLANAATFAGNEINTKFLEHNNIPNLHHLGGIHTFPTFTSSTRMGLTGVMPQEDIAAWNSCRAVRSLAQTSDISPLDYANNNVEEIDAGGVSSTHN